MIKFVFVLVITTLFCQAAVLKESCKTPGTKEGLCIKLRDCPSIWSMSNDFDTPMTVERLNYLIESQCGYADNSPKVCCPLEDITMMKEVEETTSEMQTNIKEPTSVQVGEETTSINENEI